MIALDYDDYIAEKRQRTFRGYIVFVGSLLLALVLTFALTYSPSSPPKTLANSIIWTDQDQVPGAIGSSQDTERSGVLATTIDQLFYNYTQIIVERGGEMPTVVVPHDQRVVIVGRFSFDSNLQYVLANGDTFSFAQTCVIERDGTLQLIAMDKGRALFGYVGPGYRKIPIENKCTGLEFFFEDLQD